VKLGVPEAFRPVESNRIFGKLIWTFTKFFGSGVVVAFTPIASSSLNFNRPGIALVELVPLDVAASVALVYQWRFWRQLESAWQSYGKSGGAMDFRSAGFFGLPMFCAVGLVLAELIALAGLTVITIVALVSSLMLL
jgi:hypothetical protein